MGCGASSSVHPAANVVIRDENNVRLDANATGGGGHSQSQGGYVSRSQKPSASIRTNYDTAPDARGSFQGVSTNSAPKSPSISRSSRRRLQLRELPQLAQTAGARRSPQGSVRRSSRVSRSHSRVSEWATRHSEVSHTGLVGSLMGTDSPEAWSSRMANRDSGEHADAPSSKSKRMSSRSKNSRNYLDAEHTRSLDPRRLSQVDSAMVEVPEGRPEDTLMNLHAYRSRRSRRKKRMQGPLFCNVTDDNMWSTSMRTLLVAKSAAKRWELKEVSLVSHKSSHPGWYAYAVLLYHGHVEHVCGMALTRRVEYTRRPTLVDDRHTLQLYEAEARPNRDEDDEGGDGGEGEVADGDGGGTLGLGTSTERDAKTYYADWSNDGKDLFTRRSGRVRVVAFRDHAHFAIEAASMMMGLEFGLPVPQVIGFSVGKRAANGVPGIVMTPSDTLTAAEFFAVARDDKAKVLFLTMAAFCIKCCHQRGLLLNDVSLGSFVTDGKSRFQLGRLPFAQCVDPRFATPGEPSSYPYVHSHLPIDTCAPEQFQLLQSSSASDIYQFGWMIFEVMTGSGRNERKERLDDVVDSRLYPVNSSNREDYEEVGDIVLSVQPAYRFYPRNIFDLALRCLNETPSKRPTVDELIYELGQATSLHEARFEKLASILCESNSMYDAYCSSLLSKQYPCAGLLEDCFHPLPISVRVFQAVLQDTIGPSLDLSGRGSALGEQGAAALAAALALNKSIGVVDLRGSRVGDKGALALMDALENNTSIYVIYLANCDVSQQLQHAFLIQHGERVSFSDPSRDYLVFD